jgi:hypothetical protein
MNPSQSAKQGHRYEYRGVDVLALESGEVVRVARIDLAAYWPLQEVSIVSAEELKPLPMQYFHGGTA